MKGDSNNFYALFIIIIYLYSIHRWIVLAGVLKRSKNTIQYLLLRNLYYNLKFSFVFEIKIFNLIFKFKFC